MRILITGGSGFIGKNIYEGMKNKHEIYAPTHREMDFTLFGEVADYVQKMKFDTVIHAATHNATRNTKVDLSLVFRNNLKMFMNLYRLSTFYRRMFFFGSGAEFSSEHYIPKMKESYFDQHVPSDDYGFSKYIVNHMINTGPHNIFNLRLFGCFGPYEDWAIRFISNACCKAVYNMDITMKQNVYFDYLYIKDLIKVLQHFIETPSLSYKTYNICTGKIIDLVTIAKKVIYISGKNIAIKISEPGLKREYGGDNTRMMEELGSFEFTPIDEALTELYQFYELKMDRIDKTQLLAVK